MLVGYSPKTMEYRSFHKTNSMPAMARQDLHEYNQHMKNKNIKLIIMRTQTF